MKLLIIIAVLTQNGATRYPAQNIHGLRIKVDNRTIWAQPTDRPIYRPTLGVREVTFPVSMHGWPGYLVTWMAGWPRCLVTWAPGVPSYLGDLGTM